MIFCLLNKAKSCGYGFLSSRVLGFRVHHPFQGPTREAVDVVDVVDVVDERLRMGDMTAAYK